MLNDVEKKKKEKKKKKGKNFGSQVRWLAEWSERRNNKSIPPFRCLCVSHFPRFSFPQLFFSVWDLPEVMRLSHDLSSTWYLQPRLGRLGVTSREYSFMNTCLSLVTHRLIWSGTKITSWSPNWIVSVHLTGILQGNRTHYSITPSHIKHNYIIYSKCAIKPNAKYSVTLSILHIQSQSIHIHTYLVHSIYTLVTYYPIIR